MNEAAAPAPTWIRFEKHQRHHAVYARDPAGFWTFCSRYVRGSGLVAEPTDTARVKCSCCKTRLKYPYMVPEKLQKLRGDAS